MKAMVLCAGLGERMLPLTRSVPKPAIPLLGKPIAHHALRRLARFGVERAVVNLHHLPERVRATLGDGGGELPAIRYTHEPEILGTAGGIGNAAEHLRGPESFVVVNGDFLADVDVTGAVERHRESGCAASLVLAPAREGYSTVEVDGRGFVLSIAGKPEIDPARVAGRYLFTGFQVMEPEMLDRIPAGPSDIIADVHRALVEEGRLGSVIHDGFWWEFGTLPRFLEGALELLRLPESVLAAIADTDPVRRIGDATAAVGTGADFHNAVDLRGGVALGEGARIGEGTTLEDSVVMPGARIGPGCELRRVIVAPDAVLPAGLEIEGALLLSDDVQGGEDGVLVRRF